MSTGDKNESHSLVVVSHGGITVRESMKRTRRRGRGAHGPKRRSEEEEEEEFEGTRK